MLYSNFLKKITILKILNFFKVLFSFLISNFLKKPLRWGMPFSISIEPTNYCNLKCPQCPVGLNILSRPKGFIKFELFKNIIDQTAPYLLNLFLYFQGEPFLHKKLIEMIKYANSKNIFTCIATNGHFIDKKTAKSLVKAKLDKIIISVDGLDQKTYSKYRINGNFDKVIQSIQNLTVAKKELNSHIPIVELQFLVLKTNESQTKSFKKFCKKLNANLCTLKSAQIIDFSTATRFIPNNQKFSRYKLINDSWQIKHKLHNHCWRLWNSTVITWDGKLLPCCYDKDAKYAFGKVQDEPIKNLIKNEKFKLFAQKLLTNRSEIDICTNCPE